MRIEIFRICFDAAGHNFLEVIENKHDLSRDYFLCSPDVFYVLDAAPGADCHRREKVKRRFEEEISSCSSPPVFLNMHLIKFVYTF